jgi:hypothetical protein
MAMGATCVAMLQLPLTSVLLATLLLGGNGLTVMPAGHHGRHGRLHRGGAAGAATSHAGDRRGSDPHDARRDGACPAGPAGHAPPGRRAHVIR